MGTHESEAVERGSGIQPLGAGLSLLVLGEVEGGAEASGAEALLLSFGHGLGVEGGAPGAGGGGGEPLGRLAGGVEVGGHGGEEGLGGVTPPTSPPKIY